MARAATPNRLRPTALAGFASADERDHASVRERGARLTDTEADAEGLDILPDGDRLVSFERNHRLWLYPG